MAHLNIELKTKEQIDVVISAINHKIESLKTQRAEVDKALLDLELLLNQIQPTKRNTVPENENRNGLFLAADEYDKGWPMAKKAEYVIQKNNRAMSTSEIADFICDVLEKGADRKKIVRNLSATFAQQKNRFDREKNSNGENMYAIAI